MELITIIRAYAIAKSNGDGWEQFWDDKPNLRKRMERFRDKSYRQEEVFERRIIQGLKEQKMQIKAAREYGERMHQLLIDTRIKYNLPD